MRQDKRARVEMDAGDGHEKPTGADNDDDQMEEARGGGQTEQSINTRSSSKNDEAAGTAEKGNVQHGGSSGFNVPSDTK